MILIDRHTPPDKDAGAEPLRQVKGCEHNHIACRCEIPFWLRPPAPAELKYFRDPKPRKARPGDI